MTEVTLGGVPLELASIKIFNSPVIWCDGSFLLLTAIDEFFPGDTGHSSSPLPTSHTAGGPLISEVSQSRVGSR